MVFVMLTAVNMKITVVLNVTLCMLRPLLSQGTSSSFSDVDQYVINRNLLAVTRICSLHTFAFSTPGGEVHTYLYRAVLPYCYLHSGAGIATAKGSDFESQYRQDFSPLHVFQTGSGAHPASYPMDTGGALFLGIKRPERETDHSPSASVEIRNTWVYTSTLPYAFMERCSVVRRGKFTVACRWYMYPGS
jgi:hypothetical protein